MNIQFLLSVLQSRDYNYEYKGPEKAQVITILNQKGQYAYKEGVVYYQSSIYYPAAPENICVISGESKLVEEIQDILVEYGLREAKFLELQNAMKKESYLSVDLSDCSALMENPVILLSESKRIVSWDGFGSMDELLWIENIGWPEVTNKLNTQECVYVQAHGSGTYPCLISRHSFVESRVRYIAVVFRDRAKNEMDEFFLSSLNGSMSVKGRHPTITYASKKLDDILTELFRSPPKQAEMTMHQLDELGWVHKEKYYVLAIDASLHQGNKNYEKQLESKLQKKTYYYKNYLIYILDSKWNVEYDLIYLKNLEPILVENNLYAGLSYGFFDILKVSGGVRQAIEAISYTLQLFQNQHFFAYANMIVSILGLSYVNLNHLTLDDVCHPTVLKIREYDREYHTDYLSFLSTYMYLSMSVKKTAEFLNIHKNTVYQRVQKLQDYFGIDFEDSALWVKLYVSTAVLAFNGDIDPSNYYFASMYDSETADSTDKE